MTIGIVVLAVAGILVAVNALTYWQFADDKRRAVVGERRVSESDLLWLAFCGGTPAAYAARRNFRHKTRKQPFSNNLAVIAMVQVGVLLGVCAAFLMSQPS